MKYDYDEKVYYGYEFNGKDYLCEEYSDLINLFYFIYRMIWKIKKKIWIDIKKGLDEIFYN